MKFMDILVIVASQAANEHALAFAERLARQNAGRVSAIVVNWQPLIAPAKGWLMPTTYSEIWTKAERELREETRKVARRLADEDNIGAVQSLMIEAGVAGSKLGLLARHADVTIVARSTAANSNSARTILEGALFDAGRPVIVVPPEWKGGEIGRNVLIAWKPTREAARALADAEHFIADAERVRIVTVDAKPGQEYGEQPGADIAAHLARRGVKPEMINLDAAGRTEAKAILDQAMATGADLIVMGGYGHSRMSEFIFGGVTRDVLDTAIVPILMSH